MRLLGYDYSLAGAYFITMVTHHRECVFGEVVNGEMRVNQYGKIVEHIWMDLPSHYLQITLDTFVVMPNHVHGIVVINDLCKGGSETRPYVAEKLINNDKILSHGLPEIVRAFKSFSARRINYLEYARGGYLAAFLL